MTTDRLGTALRDLVDGVEDDATPPLAADLWTGGSRRRLRSRAVTGLAAASVAALVALVVWPGGEPRASVPADGTEVVDGVTRVASHPDRIALPPFARGTDRPGITAAVVSVGKDEVEMHAVSPTGDVTHLDLPPTLIGLNPVSLSPDGRWLARGTELYDLARGSAMPSAAARSELARSRIQNGLAPWWSPDSGRAFVFANNQGTPVSDGVVLGTDGSVADAPLVAGGRVPLFAGWLDDDTMLAFVDVSDADSGTSGRLEGRTWTVGDDAWVVAGPDLEWSDLGEVALTNPPMREVTLSPDATRLTLVVGTTTESTENPSGAVAVEFDADTGGQLHPNEGGPGVVVSPPFQSFLWDGWGCRPGSYRGETLSSGRSSSPVALESFVTPAEVSSRYDAPCVAFAGGEVRGEPVHVRWPWWQDRVAAWAPWVAGAILLGFLVWRSGRRGTWRRRIEPPAGSRPELPRV